MDREQGGRLRAMTDGVWGMGGIDSAPDGRRAQSTALELALDGWRDYGNTDGRLRAMTYGAPKAYGRY